MNLDKTRLDDRFNALLVAVAVFSVIGTAALAFHAQAPAVDTAAAPIQVMPTVVIVAQR